MSGDLQATCTFFAADRKVASGDVRTVAAAVKLAADAGTPNLLVFDGSGRPMEFDLRGGLDDVLARLPAPALGEPQRRGPGRPKLGVVAREVTLLPRHWEWLAAQPGGASVALRKLVEEARKAPDQKARARAAQDAAYRFMTAVGGDLPGFEEAIRALYAGDGSRFAALVDGWPVDLRDHARSLAEGAFSLE